MKAYLAHYLNDAQSLGLSPSTLTGRKHAIGRFIDWCEDRSLTSPTDITRPILERYRRHLYHHRSAHRPLGLAAQRNHLTAIRMFFKYLARQNHLPANPASELQLPKPPRPLPKAILTHQEVEAMLNHTQIHAEKGIRDRAILETLYASGVRRMELTNLQLYDVDIDQHSLRVRKGKGGKDRLIPIGQRACQWIDHYIQDIRPQLVIDVNDDTLFLTDYGEPFYGQRLTQLVRKYILAAGIDKPGACHLFRHTMATLMLENGADIRFIQAMLGHADISTTTIYTKVSIQALREVYERTHPARLGRPGQHDEPTEDEVLLTLAVEAELDPET